MTWATSRTAQKRPRTAPTTRGNAHRHEIFAAIVILALSGAVFSLVWIYGMSLRDARYLDGWLLAAGMSLQIYFHVALKISRLQPKSAAWWRRFHIRLGLVLLAVFLSHTDFTLPDTALEWALWSLYVLVAFSGIFGAYLAWSAKAKHGLDEGLNRSRYARRTDEMAAEAQALAATTRLSTQESLLPEPPYAAWVFDLYATHIRGFLHVPRNTSVHLLGSRRPLTRILADIDELSSFVDAEHRNKLEALRALVIEKDRLDFTRAHLGLTRGWLFIHVPATYALIVFTILHIMTAYAYTSEAW